MPHLIVAAALALTQTATPAPAAQPTTGNSLSGLGGLLGGAVPNVGSIGAGNAAGLLGYCVKNKVLSGAGASSVLGKLAGNQGVASSGGYAAGQQGEVQTGNGKTFSLDGVRDRVKTQLCGVVLQRAKAFL